MKKIINYYYGFYIDKYNINNGNCYFDYNNISYILYQIGDCDIEEICLLSNLMNKKFPFYRIILTKFNQYYIIYHYKKYALLELNVNNFNFNNLINLSSYRLPNNFNLKTKLKWNELWKNKIDYLEYQFTECSLNFPIIQESFNYFLGLAENAISIIEKCNLNQEITISHKRIRSNFDFYNPFNLIIDLRVRDICEYFKYCFFNEIDFDYELVYFINNNNLTNEERKIFLARMMFPTYYFDLFEEIIGNKIEEYEIKKIINKINDFEKLLHKIYISLRHDLFIDWLENIN